MNAAVRATLVGVLGLGLGFGSGWAWEAATGASDTPSTAPSASIPAGG